MRRSTAATVLLLTALLALLVWTSLSEAQTECEICITYEGRTNCGKALAPTAEAAERAAVSTACASLASGRARSLECERMVPSRRECTP